MVLSTILILDNAHAHNTHAYILYKFSLKCGSTMKIFLLNGCLIKIEVWWLVSVSVLILRILLDTRNFRHGIKVLSTLYQITHHYELSNFIWLRPFIVLHNLLILWIWCSVPQLFRISTMNDIHCKVIIGVLNLNF